MPAINFIALPVATATAGRRAGRAFSFIRPSGRVYGGHGSGDNTRYRADRRAIKYTSDRAVRCPTASRSKNMPRESAAFLR
jgi:hypothetical protein